MSDRGFDLDGWAAQARLRERTIYGEGERPRQAVARAAVRLIDAGQIVTMRRRMPSGAFLFIAEKRGGVGPSRSAVRRARPFAARGRSAETIILRLIRDCVRVGAPCPTNAEFARRAGLSGAVSASYRLRRLVAAGKLKLDDFGPFERRVATVLPDGGSTPRATIEGRVIA